MGEYLQESQWHCWKEEEKKDEIKKWRKRRRGKDRAAKTKWVQQGWENKTHMDVFAVCQQ